MKAKILFFSLVSIFFTVAVSSCKKPEPEKPKPEKPINYPIEIAFEEYSLEGTGCEWANLLYDDKLIVINNKEELGNYINCASGSYPEIDFEKRTLILVSGANPTGIHEISPKKMIQHNANNYQLDVTVSLDDTSKKKEWSCALTVNKLQNESIVVLNSTTIAYNIFFKLPLELIQTTVIGNWQVTDYYALGAYSSHYKYYNVYAEITTTSFFMFEIENGHIVPFRHDYFTYSWEKKNVGYLIDAYVMLNNDDVSIGFYFSINEGKLVVRNYSLFGSSYYYKFCRINN